MIEFHATADYDWRRHVDESTGTEDVADAEWLVNACLDYLANLHS